MASVNDSQANVGNSRWYCHACEDETEALTEVTRRLCLFVQIKMPNTKRRLNGARV